MNALLCEMLAHRPWADAELLRAFAESPAAIGDTTIVLRLHHMVTVQRTFLCFAGGLAHPDVPSCDELSNVSDLVPLVRETHAAERRYLERVTDRELEGAIEIPFPNGPLRITRAQALAQSAMHSQHHRAQNAARLRELGGQPSTTDLILWYWLGRPEPRWDLMP